MRLDVLVDITSLVKDLRASVARVCAHIPLLSWCLWRTQNINKPEQNPEQILGKISCAQIRLIQQQNVELFASAVLRWWFTVYPRRELL